MNFHNPLTKYTQQPREGNNGEESAGQVGSWETQKGGGGESAIGCNYQAPLLVVKANRMKVAKPEWEDMKGEYWRS